MKHQVQAIGKSGMRSQDGETQVWLVTVAMTREDAKAFRVGSLVTVAKRPPADPGEWLASLGLPT